MGYETLLEQIKAVCAWNSLRMQIFDRLTQLAQLTNLQSSNLAIFVIFCLTFKILSRVGGRQSSWCQSSENCWLINQLATTQHFPFNKAESIEDFFQTVSDKPDPDLVLITAYVPDTLPDTDFLCSFHPQFGWT